MTTDEPTNHRGGRRAGAGRRPTLRPLKAVRLHDPAIREALAVLTAAERVARAEPLWSQEDMVAALIRAAHDQQVQAPRADSDEQPCAAEGSGADPDRPVPPPPARFEYTDNQKPRPDRPVPPPPTPFEYTDNQKPLPGGPLTPAIYQLRLVLVDIEPAIWRRVLVRSDATLADLHAIIQICFSWEDFHLHQFDIGGGAADEAVPLRRLGVRAGSSFGYVYDFGDNWMLEVEVEAVLPFSARRHYPTCVAGARPAPEEDSGGAWNYMEKQRRSARAKAAAKKRQQARGTTTAKQKRKPRGPTYDRVQINRRLTAWAAGDDFCMSLA